jgi:hypothetical protein
MAQHRQRFARIERADRSRFFALIIQTQLLRNVKQSHQIDLAYLYYLPFCSVFTSKDRFHAQIVPLFLNPRQTFVNGEDYGGELRASDFSVISA